MVSLHPQYINDANGHASLVVLPIAEYENIIDALEDIEDVNLYDEAKKEDNNYRIALSDYMKNRKIGNV